MALTEDSGAQEQFSLLSALAAAVLVAISLVGKRR